MSKDIFTSWAHIHFKLCKPSAWNCQKQYNAFMVISQQSNASAEGHDEWYCVNNVIFQIKTAPAPQLKCYHENLKMENTWFMTFMDFSLADSPHRSAMMPLGTSSSGGHSTSSSSAHQHKSHDKSTVHTNLWPRLPLAISSSSGHLDTTAHHIILQLMNDLTNKQQTMIKRVVNWSS